LRARAVRCARRRSRTPACSALAEAIVSVGAFVPHLVAVELLAVVPFEKGH
jgi:hypothetical protein